MSGSLRMESRRIAEKGRGAKGLGGVGWLLGKRRRAAMNERKRGAFWAVMHGSELRRQRVSFHH